MSALTLEQQAVVDCQFNDILIVNAYAGTGKTSTLVQFCEARKNSSILYLSYNSSMKKEAEIKFKHLPNVNVKTMHSLAYTELDIANKYKNRLGSLRAKDLVDAGIVARIPLGQQNLYATAILRLLRLFCNTNQEIMPFLRDIEKSPNNYELPFMVSMPFILNSTLALWKDIQTPKCKLPYEHDFYLKSYQLSKAKLDYDYILVDEAQDINACVIDIVLNQAKAKKVFIGDTYQSIYKFRGAVNSLEILSKRPRSTTLYLTQSFRCPQSIANIANMYLNILNAPKPFRGTKKSVCQSNEPKAILCRTNARLFDVAIANIEKKLFIVGGVDSCNFDDLLDVQKLMFKKHEYIKSPFIAGFKDIKELLEYSKDTGEIDLQQKVMVLYKYMKQDIRLLIKQIKGQCVKKQEKADIVLSTGHKSKGLEWDDVEILDDFVNIKKTIEEEEEIIVPKEELNLLYVAVTRAKRALAVDADYLLDDDFIQKNHERIKII